MSKYRRGRFSPILMVYLPEMGAAFFDDPDFVEASK